MLISGFQVINHSLAEDDVTALLSSCTVSVANRVIAMDAFTEIKHDGVVIVTPSICDGKPDCHVIVLSCFS